MTGRSDRPSSVRTYSWRGGEDEATPYRPAEGIPRLQHPSPSTRQDDFRDDIRGMSIDAGDDVRVTIDGDRNRGVSESLAD